jgi:flagellar L-ring protein precursor FlgH
MKNISKKINVVLATLLLTSCSTSQIDRLEWLGKQPPMDPVQPQSSTQPIMWPKAAGKEKVYASNASIWNSGSKQFFKDQRAQKIGDILTVKIEINDQAKLDNKTEAKRQESDRSSASDLFGMEDKLFGALPFGSANPASLINNSTNMNNKGEGKIDRKEIIRTDVAAVVTNVMPNGNLLIYGSQQVNVNFEQRELTVQGVIRPEDISPKNEVQYSQIAEARISYGGKGVISDIQQPRVGRQMLDIISPF